MHIIDIYKNIVVKHPPPPLPPPETKTSSPPFHMGRLRLVGPIKLYISFAKEPYIRENILQKRPTILSSLLTVATPHEYLALYYRVAETHRMPYLNRSFSAKEPYN